MAFDTGERKVPLEYTQAAPDFTVAIASYNKMVVDINVRITATKKELADVKDKFNVDTVLLQSQYNHTAGELGDKISALTARIAGLQTQSDSLDAQIKEKQATKDSISLDFIEERASLDEDQEAHDRDAIALYDAKQVLKDGEITLANDRAKLETDRTAFEADMAVKGAEIDARMTNAATLEKKATDSQADALSALQRANMALDKIAQDKAALNLQITQAQAVLVQADAVRKQAEANAIALANNSAQAFQNDKDITEIRVARVALNNIKQELSAREQMVALAEKKIGG